MKAVRVFVACGVVLMLLIIPANVSAATLMGKVLSDSGTPLAGLTVALEIADGQFRKIGPTVTNAEGFFFFPAVRRNHTYPYTITVRWGTRVLYEGQIAVNRDVDLGILRVRP